MEHAPEFSLEDVAAMVGGRIVAGGSVRIRGVAGVEAAGPGDITFYENPKFLARLRASRAAAVLVNAAVDGVTSAQIEVEGRPYLRFIDLVRRFHPQRPPLRGIHPSAVVDPGAILGRGVAVGPLAVVKAGARIGSRTLIGSQAYVGPGAEIGEDCQLFPRVVIRGCCRLGARVVVHCGAVLGDDGFGYIREGNRHVKIPHVGRVIIEDDVEIGANTTIDRATFGNTTVGAGTKIDNLVMIAHNVTIGQRCILAAQVGIAGSSSVGDDTILAGQVGVASGVRIGRGAIATAKTGIAGVIPDGQIVSGIPAFSHARWKRAMMMLARLPELASRLRGVERRLGIARPTKGSGRAGIIAGSAEGEAGEEA